MIPRLKPYESSPPCRPNIITVATPGVTATRAQISRYTGTDGVDVLENACSWRPGGENRREPNPSGETTSLLNGNNECVLTPDVDPPLLYHATCRLAPRLLNNVMASPEMDEVVYNRCSFNPVHWFLMVKEFFTAVFFSVRPVRFAYSRVRMTNLGGERDQAVCEREIRRAVRKIKERGADGSSPERPLRLRLVLFGCSRGATTTLYTALKLPYELACYVSLVVVEAPFDTLHDVIAESSWFPNFTMWFFRTFCEYNGNEPYAFDPSRVQLRCPVAFVLSLKDTRVPNKLTRRLINVLKTQCPQIPAVEVLELKHSRHPLMAVGHREDQDAYVAFMERLYDTYCS
ncbi:hypothetical protein DQ04_03941030 [Trypanosoma grayi]|uniref:hypothetical protein n=1 Tax=Trypanosoma grayi TaxID=71804 RepID=UPI0004F4B5D0|nr:hypothetical protein DQ04_03941030 [Trypanosoma grayi]KEG10277.1 hypothetical protein DQ04_03941030 [Trypanosoma grayi]